MAKMQFTFNLDTGECNVEAVGFKGKGCKVATDPYTQALGMVGATIKEKPEYRQVPDQVKVKS